MFIDPNHTVGVLFGPLPQHCKQILFTDVTLEFSFRPPGVVSTFVPTLDIKKAYQSEGLNLLYFRNWCLGEWRCQPGPDRTAEQWDRARRESRTSKGQAVDMRPRERGRGRADQ